VDLIAPDQFFTVTEITRVVRDLLESQIGQVWVEGEVSNYRKQPSGHQYFTLKDERSQLACVQFFRGRTGFRATPLSDGMKVRAYGTLTVYEARGQYQLNVSLVQAAGAGLLQAKFEALKRQLESEGLFEPARKRPLPPVPATIGIVTSPTGAAIRDMLSILGRRAPWVRVIIHPARVQGEGAGEEIARGIETFGRAEALGLPRVDLLIIGRGGGSIEDLWAFNEEIVARAIAASPIPVVSAVGHEIDFTIADFVADLRAPTPSAAAELVVPDAATLAGRFRERLVSLGRRVTMRLDVARSRLAVLARGRLFSEPERQVREAAQRIDHARESAYRSSLHRVADRRHRLAELAGRVASRRPDQVLKERAAHLRAVTLSLRERASRALERRRNKIDRCAMSVRMLSPEATLERGYSITLDADGHAIRSVKSVKSGEAITTRVRDGSVASTVTAVSGPRG
jgi:exodeoxyribonuclease VII large subunit